MPVDWSLYEKLLGSDCVQIDARQDAIVSAVDSFLDGIVDDPAYQCDARVEGDLTPLVASRTAAHQCSIVAAPNTDIHIGDMVECLSERWIVVELYMDKIGLMRGVMWLCNETIRFQNHSSSVHVRQCVIDNGTYSKKSSDPDAFVMANTYRMYLPRDAETEKMFVDKRLSFGHIYDATGDQILEVYKIIGIDSKTPNHGDGSHIMMVTLQRDVYNPSTDSLEDNLCDVYRPADSVAKPTPGGSCVIHGKDTIRIGTRRKYTAVFTDPAGNEITDITPVWSLTLSRGSLLDIKHEIDGMISTIELPLSSDLVGDTISIMVRDNEGKYGTFRKKVRVISVG